MRAVARFSAIFIANLAAMAGGARAQEMQMPKQEHGERQHGEMTVVKPEYPRMGRAQEHAQGALVTLEQVQKIATESNPTLRQAQATAVPRVRARGEGAATTSGALSESDRGLYGR